jgi:serine phosphatase RsbU (regulator of sigma subunit)
LRYSSAGHDTARILDPDGSSRRLEANGPLLGVLAQPEFGEAQLALEPGGHLVVVTDGVVESRPPGTLEFFGAERALCSVAKAVHAQADPAGVLIADVLRHTGGVPADDAAALVVAW